jgi:hypothetical protein
MRSLVHFHVEIWGTAWAGGSPKDRAVSKKKDAHRLAEYVTIESVISRIDHIPSILQMPRRL